MPENALHRHRLPRHTKLAKRVLPAESARGLNEDAACQKLAPGSMLLQPMRTLSKTAIGFDGMSLSKRRLLLNASGLRPCRVTWQTILLP